MIFNLSKDAARDLVANKELDPTKHQDSRRLPFELGSQEVDDDVAEVAYPEFHMAPITGPLSQPGVDYLASRDISLDMAVKYEMTYSPLERRVYFPIKMGGRFYGYQGRAIDKVEDKDRMRNNDEFRRDRLVMFADNLEDSTFAIISEGPVDALKFEQVGSNICTMGKVVTDRQLETIYAYGVEELYLALDDDAAAEITEIAKKAKRINMKVFRVNVPDSCRTRCQSNGKKADFGECTYEEAAQAFRDATIMKPNSFLLYVPKGVR